jgi:hypothetical protein
MVVESTLAPFMRQAEICIVAALKKALICRVASAKTMINKLFSQVEGVRDSNPEPMG